MHWVDKFQFFVLIRKLAANVTRELAINQTLFIIDNIPPHEQIIPQYDLSH